MDKKVIMPEKLTAENGAKTMLIGEFFIPLPEYCRECDGDGCGVCQGKGEIVRMVNVPWTTIKEIYTKAVEHLSQPVNSAD